MMRPRAREENLLTQEATDELVVYDEERNQAHRLNRSATLVWRHCDGQKTVAELTTLLQQELNPVADEDLVWLTLARLEAACLLQEPVRRTPDQTRSSRRQFVRKVGLVGSLSLLLPVVATITAPTPAQAAVSPGPTCVTCSFCECGCG